MCKRNKVCIYMFIVVMVLQIIIPALSVIIETSYTLTSEAAYAWDIGAEGSKITATLYNTTLQINGTGKIKDNIKWIKNGKDYRRYFFNIIINKFMYKKSSSSLFLYKSSIEKGREHYIPAVPPLIAYKIKAS